TLFLQLHTLFLQLLPGFLQLYPIFLQLHTRFLQLYLLFLQLHTRFLQLQPAFLQLQPAFLQLYPIFLQLLPVFLQLHTLFLQLHTIFLQLHTIFLQLHTQHPPTTPLQQKNDSYPPKGRATIAHQSINVCTKIFRTNSGKNNCFSSAFAISGMRRPNENISPVAKRYVRFGSSGTPSNSTSSTLSTPSSSKYVSTCKFANTRRPTTS